MTKIILITGSRKGIGRYLSEYYLDKGFIVIGCSRNESDLKNNNYHHKIVDVTNENEVKKLSVFIRNKFERIDFLINNAGVASMNHSLLTPLSTVKKVFETNLYGTFLLCREIGKLMANQKNGRIVNFTTVAVPLNLEGEAIYASSKAAVESLTRILSKEFGGFGITCNSIGPSPVKTDLIKNVPEGKLQDLLSKQAISYFADFEDVANVVDFFISDRSKMITGQTIYLSGVF